MAVNITNIFSSFQEHLDKEQNLREDIRAIVKEIDQAGREIITILQVIHQTEGMKDIATKCNAAREIIKKDVHPGYQKLCQLFSTSSGNQYYRYHDNWRFITQRLTFIIALIVYLDTGNLVKREQVADELGINLKREDGFHLDLEDYLMGLLQLSSELSRLAVNSVTNGDYNRPLQISKFVTELNAGFRLLNLKNDSLRKRFDALKYDVKKIEEVVYDLSIRGLKAEPQVG